MHRIFCPQATSQDAVILIDDPQEFHHLRDVLRLGEGDEVEVVNGQGLLVRGRIASLQKRSAAVEVQERNLQESSSGRKIILACAVPKKAKFETIIEKCTELGVDEIIPLLTDRTEMRLSASARKDERFYKVIVNASKQSKRLFFPVLYPVTRFDDVLKDFAVSGTKVLIPWLEGDRVPLKTALEQGGQFGTVLVLIGPEGDFTPDEAARAVAKGALPVSLGETTLKVDTAAISVVAAIRLGGA